MPLEEARLRKLLAPFWDRLGARESAQILAYLDLLLRWNRRINLTAVRTPEECVTRHFGESLFLAARMPLAGHLLDIGSGAGFPGLVLKIAVPSLNVTLLEPASKKRAFLKEVLRACGMHGVEVRAERLEQIVVALRGQPAFDVATARAVGRLSALVPAAARCVRAGGRLCLWVSREQRKDLLSRGSAVSWSDPLIVPLSRQREIWIGTVNPLPGEVEGGPAWSGKGS